MFENKSLKKLYENIYIIFQTFIYKHLWFKHKCNFVQSSILYENI
jgi:hypothetical protein